MVVSVDIIKDCDMGRMKGFAFVTMNSDEEAQNAIKILNDKHHCSVLQDIAHKAMLERGLNPDFSTAALAELEKILASAARS